MRRAVRALAEGVCEALYGVGKYLPEFALKVAVVCYGVIKVIEAAGRAFGKGA